MTIYAARVSSIINRVGETVIIRRVTASTMNTTTLQNTNITTDTTIKASVRFYKASEIGGLVQQGDREVRVAAADLTTEPKPNDKVLIGSKIFNVVSVAVRRPCDVAAVYILQVRG